MNFEAFINKIIGIVALFVPVLIGLAVLVFLYGMATYIANSGDESKRKESIKFIVYGIIGLFVMVAIWGIVGLFTGTFGFGDAIVPQIKV